MIYFGFYFNVKDAIPTSPVAASLPSVFRFFSRDSRVSQPPRLSARDCKCLTALISWAAHRHGGGGGGEGGGGSEKSESDS